MLKPNLLRAALSATNAYLRENPDSLAIFVGKGSVVSTGQASLSHEYRYPLKVLVMDYPFDIDTLVLPLQAWIRTHQPDIHFNPDLREKGFSFEADILSADTVDILFTLSLTEAAIVSEHAGKLTVTHRTEPAPTPYEDVSAWTLDTAGAMVATWVSEQMAGNAP